MKCNLWFGEQKRNRTKNESDKQRIKSMKAKSSDIENDVTAQQISAEKEDEKNSRAVLFDLEHRRTLYRGGGDVGDA